MEQIQFACSPEQAQDLAFLTKKIRKELKLKEQQQLHFRWKKRSIDARQRQIKINATFEVAIDQELGPRFAPFIFQKVAQTAQCIHIIGAGPAGLFAALEAILCGIKPIIYERGKDIRARRRDLAKLTKNHELNPESNYCFG